MSSVKYKDMLPNVSWKDLSVSHDTRSIKEGQYYIPVKGEKFDGHDFIPQALEKGALEVLEEDELYQLTKKKLKEYNPTIIGITGSIGKTTAKDAVCTFLSSKYKVLASEGNLNTKLGLSETIVNDLLPEHKLFVAEMGMYVPGEIADICLVIPPDISILTVIAGAHLEHAESIDNIIRGKGEILEALSRDGIGLLNADNENVMQLKNTGVCKKIYYSEKDVVDIDLEFIPLLGIYKKSLVAMLLKLGELFNFSQDEVKLGLTNIKNTKGRLNRLVGINDCVLLDDTYNSHPKSALASLKVLITNFDKYKKIAILGDMLELSYEEAQGHLEVATYACAVCDQVIFIGDRMKVALEKLNISIDNKKIFYAHDWEAAILYIGKLNITAQCVVLVKASQGLRLENISKELLKDKTSAKDVLVRQTANWI